jgi:hypothetical protein
VTLRRVGGLKKNRDPNPQCWTSHLTGNFRDSSKNTYRESNVILIR